MIDIKYHNLIKKIAKFKNDNSNYNEHKNMDEVNDFHHNFINECNIDWELLTIYLHTLQSYDLYFKGDKYGRKTQKICKRNETHSLNTRTFIF